MKKTMVELEQIVDDTDLFTHKTPSNAAKRLSIATSLLETPSLEMSYKQRILAAYSLCDFKTEGHLHPWQEVASKARAIAECEDFDLNAALDMALLLLLDDEGSELFSEQMAELHAEISPTIDFDAAVFWYEQSLKTDTGTGTAARAIAETFIYCDRRFQTRRAGPVFHDVIGYLDKAIAHGNARGRYLKALIYIKGYGTTPNIEFGLEELKQAADDSSKMSEVDADYVLNMCVDLLLVHQIASSCSSNPFAELKNTYQKYKQKYNNKDYLQYWDGVFELADQEPYKDLIAACVAYKENKISAHILKAKVIALSSPEHIVHTAKTLNLFLLLERHLQRAFPGRTRSKEKTLSSYVELLQNTQSDVTKEVVSRNRDFYGPIYSPMDKAGRSILGVWHSAAQNDNSGEGYYIPQAGVQTLDAIYADETGIKFVTTDSDTLPAKLLPEDFDVAQALIFGDPEGPILPSFSLPHLLAVGEGHINSGLKQKQLSPEWLHFTALGQTLYAADKMMGDVAFHPLSQPVGASGDSVIPEAPGIARKFLVDLFNTAGQINANDAEVFFDRIMLVPENVGGDAECITKTNGELLYSIRNISISMRVDGEVHDTNVSSDPDTINNIYYKFPRRTEKLTLHFDALKTLLPIFQRAEELPKLLNALLALRAGGYNLPAPELARAQEYLASLRSAPALTDKDIICRPR